MKYIVSVEVESDAGPGETLHLFDTLLLLGEAAAARDPRLGFGKITVASEQD
jgi:hypothetical protein